MRVQKASKHKSHGLNGSSCLSAHELLLWRHYDELVLAPTKEIVARLFVQHVMSPLLGAKHVDVGVCVEPSLYSLCTFTCYGKPKLFSVISL